MFHSAALKLTTYYLGIIMAISLVFSVALYRISTQEVDRGLRRQPVSVQIFSTGPDFEDFRQSRVDESSIRLRNQLIFFNLVTLIIGGGLSYLLARRTLEPIEEAMEAQGRFVSDASHELRTPLTAMQAEIEVGLRDPKLKLPTAKALLESNLEEVGKLRDLSNGLLRLTRSNGKDMPKTPVNLHKVAIEAIEQLANAAKQKKIIITDKVPDLSVMADQPSLKEVLVILLDNALKYSNPDTTITVSATQSGKHAIIKVADQGVGIKAIDLGHIFERFYRADMSRTKNQVDGYGLGLSIAQQLVEAMDGSLEVTSQSGVGSTFSVKLQIS